MKAKGKPCCTLFTKDHFIDVRDQCATLNRDELDMAILGQIMGNIYMDDMVGKRSSHTLVPRERARMSFTHHGMKICKATWLMLVSQC